MGEPSKETVSEIVTDVEKSYGIRFTQDEIEGITEYTKRKLKAIRKEQSYFRLLFENELRDYCMRWIINKSEGAQSI